MADRSRTASSAASAGRLSSRPGRVVGSARAFGSPARPPHLPDAASSATTRRNLSSSKRSHGPPAPILPIGCIEQSPREGIPAPGDAVGVVASKPWVAPAVTNRRGLRVEDAEPLRADEGVVVACLAELEEQIESADIDLQHDRGDVHAGRDLIAEARVRDLTVVTYEGRTFSGAPTSEQRWSRSMPGICLRLGVDCVTLPEALGELGGSF